MFTIPHSLKPFAILLVGAMLSISSAHAAPQSPALKPSTAKPAPKDPFAHLTPLLSKPGIVICEPVPATANRALADFGAGCSRWLQFVVGGQGELGQMAAWAALGLASHELGKSDLRLNLEQAKALSARLGSSQVAVSQCQGNEQHCYLSYQLWKMPEHKTVGSPLKISGSLTEVAAKLPYLAHDLTIRLGVAVPHVPDSAPTADELALSGQIDWNGSPQLAPEKWQNLLNLAQRQPLAALLALEHITLGHLELEWAGDANLRLVNDELLHRLVRDLITQAPDNLLGYTAVSALDARELLPFDKQVNTVIQRFPSSYLAAMLDANWQRSQRHYLEAQQAAERGVRLVPRSPLAWSLLTHILYARAQEIGDMYYQRPMPAPERALRRNFYALCLIAATHAAHLDPISSPLWTDVAKAAMPAQNYPVADPALQQALKLDNNNIGAYEWGLEMYRPQLHDLDFDGPHMQKLRQLLKTAVTDPDRAAFLAPLIKYTYRMMFEQSQGMEVAASIKAQLRALLAHAPNNVTAHYRLLFIIQYMPDKTDDDTQMLTELNTLVQLMPQSAEMQYRLANFLAQRGQVNDSIPHYQEAMRLNPYHLEAQRDYAAFPLYMNSQYGEAEKLLREVLQARPNDGAAHRYLGAVLYNTDHQDEAIVELTKGNRSPYDYELGLTRNLLCDLYTQQGKYATAIQYAQAALDADPADDWTQAFLGGAYLKSQQIDKCLTACQAALKLNAANPVAHEYLGEALWAKGQQAAARTEWEKTIALESKVWLGPRFASQARKMLATNLP